MAARRQRDAEVLQEAETQRRNERLKEAKAEVKKWHDKRVELRRQMAELGLQLD